MCIRHFQPVQLLLGQHIQKTTQHPKQTYNQMPTYRHV